MNQPSKIVAGLLAIFLGSLGLHQIYLRRYNVGVIWFLVALLFCWTLVVPIVLAIISFIQGIGYLLCSNDNWKRTYSAPQA